MGAHTPGPWTQGRTLLTPQTRDWHEERWVENDKFERRMVFANFSSIDRGIGRVRIAACESADDARLIAAAPDLLEALEDFLSSSRALCLDHLLEKEMQNASAAIAKAKGETQ